MFQTEINQNLAAGVVGEYADDSPRREKPYILLGQKDEEGTEKITVYPEIACVFTHADEEGQAVIGGRGVFAGVLVNPKAFANYKGLNATLELPNGIQGGLCTFGHINVAPTTAFAIGSVAAYDPATGKIGAYASDSAIPETSVKIANAEFIGHAGNAGEVAVLQLGN